MSYILEALRRAEAERERPRGEPLDLAPAAPAAAAPRSRWLPAALAVLLMGGAAGAAAWWFWPAREPVPALAPPAAPTPAVALAPAPAPAPAPVASAALPAPPALLQQAGARTLPAPAASAPAAVAPERVPRLAELPAATRQQLPPLQLGGSMHSPDARLRSLILNGQLYREGDWVTPQLQVEAIGPRAATLRFGAQRFELPY